MTPVEWIGAASGVLGLATGTAALARMLTTHGADRQRLTALEDWQRAKSIDRSQLDDVIKDVRKLEERVDCVEGDVKSVADLLTEIRVDLARIPEQLKLQDQVMELRFKAVDHSIAGLKHTLEGMVEGRLRPA